MLILLVSFHIILPYTRVIVGCNEVKSSTEKKSEIRGFFFFFGQGVDKFECQYQVPKKIKILPEV